MISDIRFSLRTLFRAPGFSLVSIFVLALGIGATTAVFTLVERLLFSPLPYPNGERLVWIWNTSPNGTSMHSLFAADVAEMRGRMQSFKEIGGEFPGTWNVTGIGEPQRLSGARVTEGFLETLGVSPQIGRLFRKDEYRTGRENVVIFSHAFWQSRLGSNPNIVGTYITMDGNTFEVAGVMPADFPLSERDDLWAPLPPDSPFAAVRNWRWVRTCARLHEGVTLEQAQAELNVKAAELSARFPEDKGFGLKLVTFLDQEVGSVRQTLWIFAAAVACVLLIACSNVASLLLARGTSRTREMAVRAAIGATRGDLVRQMLIESALLAIAGAALGIPLALLGVKWLREFVPQALPRVDELYVDTRVLLFTFVLSLVTALIFGIAPALRGSRTALRETLAEGGRSGSGRQSNRMRSALVVAEVALGVVLLASAALLARSFQRLMNVHPGYDVQNILSMQIALSNVRYRQMSASLQFFEQAIKQIEEIPGVKAAGGTNYLPLEKNNQTTNIWLESQPVHSDQNRITIDNRVVTPGYFRAMGIPLIAGRFFEWTDRVDAPKVIMVNEAFVREFYPQGGAVGRQVELATPNRWTAQIIGVVADYRENTLMQEPRRELFTCLAQTTIGGQTLVVRSAREPQGLLNAIRGAIAKVDPDVPVYNVRTMERQVYDFTARPRLRGTLIGIFAILALVLSALGLYGLIACAVAERKREIGIRIALGADQGEVRRMVVGQGLKLTIIGLAIGFIGAAAATRLLEGFLFGVSSADPVAYGLTAVLFIGVALAASYVPARRATRVDPMTTLREE